MLTRGEPIARGVQENPDVVEGITLAPAVTGRVLLDATAHLTWGIASLCDDVTGTWHAGCARGAGPAMVFLLSREGDRAWACLIVCVSVFCLKGLMHDE